MFSEIIKEIGADTLYNLHSHTQFCDGHAPMEDFAREAASRGFKVYAFTPHSPVREPNGCNMSADSLPAYFAEVERIRRLYPQVHFLAGMEIDYIDGDLNAASDLFTSLPLDFKISSVHFIPNQDGRLVDIDGRPDRFCAHLHEFFRDDLRYVVDTYFDRSEQMLATGGFDIIGHFDKVKRNASAVDPDIESRPWYRERLDRLTDLIIASGVAVDINTKHYGSDGIFYPAPRLWRRLRDAGVTIVVNSDAHDPHAIDASRAEAFSLLNSL